MDPEAFDRVYALNVRAVALCYKHAARQMIKQGWGGRLIGTFSLVQWLELVSLTGSTKVLVQVQESLVRSPRW